MIFLSFRFGYLHKYETQMSINMDGRIKKKIIVRGTMNHELKDRLYLKVKYFTHFFKPNRLQNKCQTKSNIHS